MQAHYLVFGGETGWIGQKMVTLVSERGIQVTVAKSRLENTQDVAQELDKMKPTHVLNCAGLTGRPNVDWCEEHKQEVIRVNVIGTLALLDNCEQRNIHCTNFATGCIYNYDAKYPVGGPPIPESYPPNYTGSYYSLTKGMVDRLCWDYKNVLTLRLRMPISDDLNPRNFVTKISSYKNVINVPNSVTILHDLLPVAFEMGQRQITGVFNFTNPGTVSHNEVLDLYREYIDPNFTYSNFSEEEQSKILKAGRCNNYLSVEKMAKAVPDLEIPHVKDSIRGVFQRMQKNLAQSTSKTTSSRTARTQESVTKNEEWTKGSEVSTRGVY